MHVLIVPSWYPTAEEPTGGVFFQEQARAVRRSGIKVGVIVPGVRSLREFSRRPFPFKRAIDYRDEAGIPTYRWNGYGWLPRIPGGNLILAQLGGRKLFHAYVSAHGVPDVVHAHSAIVGGALAAWIKASYGVPYVITEHSSAHGRGRLSKWERSAAERVFRAADRRLVVSPALGETLSACYGDDSRSWDWVPNLVDPAFGPAGDSPRAVGGGFTFLTVGRLNENKGHADLIRAFARAFAEDPRVVLRLVGEGPELDRLMQLANSLGVLNRIAFLGARSRPEVVEEMGRADAFVLASRYETFGVVLIEALASGVPVIATACGGPDVIVTGDNGLLTPVGNIDELAAAMARMRSIAATFDPDRLRADCLRRFGTDAVVSRLTEVYADLKNATVTN